MRNKYFIFFVPTFGILLLPPYQKAGYATDEPLQKKKIVSPFRSLPPQSKTASGAPDQDTNKQTKNKKKEKRKKNKEELG